ncbi:MAG: methyltransferase domain-containing protein [Opitutaceae bacterium]
MPESPTDPVFWNQRYLAGQTPWDFGGVPLALRRYLAGASARRRESPRALIPGCGSGHEIAAFADAGYDVTAIDISSAAAARARAQTGARTGVQVIEGDFFTHVFPDGPFDCIYERTFLCALPPALWPRMVARYAELLRPGGALAGFYLFGEKEDGPPFGLATDEPERLFSAAFTLTRDEPVPAAESLEFFAGREHWQERIRKTKAS